MQENTKDNATMEKPKKPLYNYSPKQIALVENYVEAVESGNGKSNAEIVRESGYSSGSSVAVLKSIPIQELIALKLNDDWLTKRTYDNIEAAKLGTVASTQAITLGWKLKGQLQEGSRTNILNVSHESTNSIDTATLEKLANDMANAILAKQLEGTA